MDDLFYWLNQIQLPQRLSVGDKALNLSRLQQDGYPTLPGFVIPCQTFYHFLEGLDHSQSLLADFPASSLYLDVENPQVLQLVARQSRQTILKENLPEEWLSIFLNAAETFNSDHLILRTSIALSIPVSTSLRGLLPSQVCWKTSQGLEGAIKRVWSGLFSAKSLFYWQRLGIGLEQVNLAILVQPIYNAIASGIASLQSNSLHLQASWGLGYSLYWGEVAPDIYQIDTLTGKIKHQKLGNKSRAYRLKPPTSSNFAQDCLESYLLSETQQLSYCLDHELLNRLIELFQSIQAKNQPLKGVEWTLFNSNNDPDSQGELSLITSDLNPSDSLPHTEPLTPTILSGLAASSGVEMGQVYLINNTDLFLGENLTNKILVSHSIKPEWLPALKQVKGFITEMGGLTSHGAIIARELGIPAIVGAKNATKILKHGQLIQVNGTQGMVTEISEQISLETLPKTEYLEPNFTPFSYPIATQLMVNLSQPSSIPKVLNLPIDGVGLLRSELMLLDLFSRQSLQDWLHPSQHPQLLQEWTDLINQFVQAFNPRPIFYRSLDLKNIYPASFPLINSQSDLGNRGTFSYKLDPLLFDLELKVLAQICQLGNSNINLILPFVRSVEEFIFCRHRIEKAGLNQYPSFQLWIMAEVPSVIFLLSEYVKAGVQGIAIGTNDLTQLLLGVDREETSLTKTYNVTHPAMLAALQQLITHAKMEGIPCSICGKTPLEYPQLIENLIRWGITAISVEPEGIESTYKAIARSELRLLLDLTRQNRNEY